MRVKSWIHKYPKSYDVNVISSADAFLFCSSGLRDVSLDVEKF